MERSITLRIRILNTGDNLGFMVTWDLFARRYYEDLQEENKRYPGEAPFPWLEAQFKQLGLDVYRKGGLLFHSPFSNIFCLCSLKCSAVLGIPK
jgi:hypothetical protein